MSQPDSVCVCVTGVALPPYGTSAFPPTFHQHTGETPPLFAPLSVSSSTRCLQSAAEPQYQQEIQNVTTIEALIPTDSAESGDDAGPRDFPDLVLKT